MISIYITYDEYQYLKYTKVPPDLFEKIECAAACIIDKYTSRRLQNFPDPLCESEKYGVCEVIDAVFDKKHSINSQNITSFSNGKYSEHYSPPLPADLKIARLIELFFAPDHIWRSASRMEGKKCGIKQ